MNHDKTANDENSAREIRLNCPQCGLEISERNLNPSLDLPRGIAVTDIVGAVSGSTDAHNYWYVLKNRLKKAGNQTLTKCRGFKLIAADGKRRLTDCLEPADLKP